nr:immunoglobulin light chain junction region [Mus musculus]NSM01746.1 immunoglobulin light chain junction region [Mus musculus]
CQQDYSSPPTF